MAQSQDPHQTGQMPQTQTGTSSARSNAGAGQPMSMSRDERSLPERQGRYAPASPFALMRRFSEDMDRFFDRLINGRGEWPRMSDGLGQLSSWPEIEVSQQGNKLLVQADVPGMKKEDVSVEVRDHELCISGERRSESQHSRGGYYQSERSYGSFCRTIPLPEGANAESATATFKDGVLRVEIEAPGGATQGRRVEIRDAH